MKRFIKKHKVAVVGIVILLIFVILLLILKSIFFPNENKAIYGSRINGRKNVEISDSTKNKIKSDLSEMTSEAKVRVAGRTVEVLYKVNNDVSRDDAKALGNKVLEELSDKEKNYYDVQIFVENDGNEAQFPIIGYKHHTNKDLVWTKDRG